jgi:hypothetical protein
MCEMHTQKERKNQQEMSILQIPVICLDYKKKILSPTIPLKRTLHTMWRAALPSVHFGGASGTVDARGENKEIGW